MAKQADSLVQIIRDYLTKHPEKTWKVAAPDLVPLGITETYFSNQKTKLRKEGVVPKFKPKKTSKPSKAKVSKPKAASALVAATTPVAATKPSAAPTNDLTSAVEFARAAGGLDEARKLLDDLSKFQI